MLGFDDRTRQILDTAYLGSDVVRRRLANFAALDPRPADRVLDLGCGQGLLTAEIARAVGPEGRVTGVDPSPAMRSAAAERCAGMDQVTILDGRADALPLEDGSLDRAVSLQVFEYLDDIPAALAELTRVLCPGGRLVVGDVHWGTFVWRSDEPDRMSRMMASWEHHLADLAVPASLPAHLEAAGFACRAVTPVTFVDTCLRRDGLAAMMRELMRDFTARRADLAEAEISAWASEQDALAAAGRFFFSLTHFVVTADRR